FCFGWLFSLLVREFLDGHSFKIRATQILLLKLFLSALMILKNCSMISPWLCKISVYVSLFLAIALKGNSYIVEPHNCTAKSTIQMEKALVHRELKMLALLFATTLRSRTL
ncbi:hypothetical protein QQP08_024229, partial [Theobroma cacao]